MFKGLVSGIVLTLVTAAIGGYFVLQAGIIPANADAKPGPIEIWAAKLSLNATMDRKARRGRQPLQ